MASKDIQRDDLNRLRDLVLADTVAIGKWPQLLDKIVALPVDIIRLKKLVTDGKYADAILESLQIWHAKNGQLEELVDALEHCHLKRLADRVVQECWGNGSAVKGLVWFQIDEVERNFTGRQKELDTIHTMLSSLRKANSVLGSIVCISGLGGVGKSSLARKYAFEHHRSYETNVVWIHGQTLAALRNSFQNLADFLKLPITGSESENIYLYFNNKKCLFIFDNVEESARNMREFLPRAMPGHCMPYILMTSRRNDILETRNNHFYLDVLKIEEAVVFIQGERSCSTSTDATNLALKLEMLPLALQQSMALIQTNYLPEDPYAICSYLKEFDASGPHALFREDEMYVSTVLTTWNVTLQKILTMSGGAAAEQLLYVLAYLGADHITVALLTQMTTAATTESLNLLSKFSLITISAQGVLRIHRLLQHALRTTLSSNPAHDESLILGSIIKFIHAQLVDSRGWESRSTVRICTMHGIHMYSYLRPHMTLIQQNPDYASNLCYHAIQHGYCDQALVIAKECSQVLQAAYSPDDPRTMEMEMRVGHCQYRLRAYDSAETIFDLLLDRWTRAGLPLTAKLFLNLQCWKARIYKCRKNFGVALEILDDIISTSRATYGSKDYDTLQFTHYKAVVLMRSANLTSALDAFESVHKTMSESLGEGHLSTVRAKRYVATVSHKMGNWERALALHKEVRSALSLLMGSESREVVNADNAVEELEQKLRQF